MSVTQKLPFAKQSIPKIRLSANQFNWPSNKYSLTNVGSAAAPYIMIDETSSFAA